MSLARFAVVGVAAVAAVGAGLLAMNLSENKPQEPVIITTAPAQPPIRLVDVLVTKTAVPMGNLVSGHLGWQKWPEDGVGPDLILKSNKPNAVDSFAGAIAKQSFFAGEPVRESKLIRPDHGFMSAILDEGKRAVAVRISADTAAGGFILPNDHVDVIMTRRVDTSDGPGGVGQRQRTTTETVLKNLRVLAIDQSVQEKDGEKVVLGQTATLEVTPQQAEALTAAQQMADRLVLSLRALADSVPGSPGYARFLLEQKQADPNKIRVVRYGRIDDVTTTQ
ncbi:Flp pilus assembly protein CpaB [Jiella sp. MQZ9-1]|uniref:Flp pilus assembly protein CpaB n=1 Tax=Jiella flava TaxID=2816857 RepID=A0A939FX93_9HYPH|nr:Flp pilus assembly protein CpaB [Jiella flava]MBO0663683.1 Flp pilus assembly protein CpaB [Jiella flava]MCD2472256.1 Flp pilus assembly protein CpaB [Jiella flava]